MLSQSRRTAWERLHFIARVRAFDVEADTAGELPHRAIECKVAVCGTQAPIFQLESPRSGGMVR